MGATWWCGEQCDASPSAPTHTHTTHEELHSASTSLGGVSQQVHSKCVEVRRRGLTNFGQYLPKKGRYRPEFEIDLQQPCIIQLRGGCLYTSFQSIWTGKPCRLVVSVAPTATLLPPSTARPILPPPMAETNHCPPMVETVVWACPATHPSESRCVDPR